MRSLLALAVLLALPACDSAALDGDLAENTFWVRVGDAEAETRAEAHFGSYVSTTTGPTFAVVLGARPLSAPLSLAAPAVGFAFDGASVTPGTYELAPVRPGGEPPQGAFVGVYIDPAQYVVREPGRGIFYTGAGSVTIDAIDGGRARGTFEMTAVELGSDFAPSDAEVRVTGAFHAVETDAFGDEESFWR
ncbi:hypothetical protein [Rubrivirga sp.]|uniref:hypothetical protein n=1 Tax=Rubrivirga sp. TaxID=1885344 RepID=UPI003B52CDF3